MEAVLAFPYHCFWTAGFGCRTRVKELPLFLSAPRLEVLTCSAGTDLGLKDHVCNGDLGLSQSKTGHRLCLLSSH